MPVSKRKFMRSTKRRPRLRFKRAAGLATYPKLMSKARQIARYHGVSSRTYWFKTNGQFVLNAASYQFDPIDTQRISTVQPKGWNQCLALYDQYKVLGMVLKMFPANVGTEPTGADQFQTAPGPGGLPVLINRGNHVMYIDQRRDSPGVANPTSIGQIINRGSARMINPRRPWTTSLWRPKGKPLWGSCKDILASPDAWNGQICHFCEGGSVIPNTPAGAPQTFTVFYYTLTWKVVFRGRQSN